MTNEDAHLFIEQQEKLNETLLALSKALDLFEESQRTLLRGLEAVFKDSTNLKQAMTMTRDFMEIEKLYGSKGRKRKLEKQPFDRF